MAAKAIPCCLLLIWAASSPAQEIRITWDKDLAFEYDRDNYERTLKDIIAKARESVTGGLGIVPRRPLGIQVLSHARYRRQFGAGRTGPAGAHYQGGAIFVNGGNRLDQRFAGLIEHEMVHAVVNHEGGGGHLPTWLNEGVAELFRWRRMGMRDLARNQIDELQRAREQDKLTPLPVSKSLTPFQYLLCYAVVLFIEDAYGPAKLRSLVLETLEQRSFDKACKKVLATEMRFLERGFGTWVKELR